MKAFLAEIYKKTTDPLVRNWFSRQVVKFITPILGSLATYLGATEASPEALALWIAAGLTFILDLALSRAAQKYNLAMPPDQTTVKPENKESTTQTQ